MRGSDRIAESVDWKDPVSTGRFLVDLALAEDAVTGDCATDALAGGALVEHSCMARAREQLVVAGWFLAGMVFERISELCGLDPVEVVQLIPEGSVAGAGETIGLVKGPAGAILRGERIVLNMLCRLSGVATLTGRYIREVSGTGVEILDTRKTTPCHRALERYAVRMGGGVNHRFDLAEMAMIKDNHIASTEGATGLADIMKRLRSAGHMVEIEVDSLKQLPAVLELAPDRILLDNMMPLELEKAVSIASGSCCYMEASGGISLDNLRRTAETGIDGISSGALTHSAAWADIGFDWSTE